MLWIINNNPDCHSISLTGGEPLLHTDFIKELGKKCIRKYPIYLETNGTLPDKLAEVLTTLIKNGHKAATVDDIAAKPQETEPQSFPARLAKAKEETEREN